MNDIAPWLSESPRFATTRWTVVRLAGGAGPDRGGALEQFCRAYWYPVYAFIRRRGNSAEDSHDLAQEFFARLVEKDWLARVERRDDARFSTLLVTMLKRFLVNEYERAHTARRGGGQVAVDFAGAEARIEAESSGGETPEKMFERHWALAVLEAALAALRAETEEAGKARVFEVLSPFLSREPAAGDYETAGAALGLSARTVAVAVHRLRHRYRDFLRAELAAGLLGGTQVEDEMRHLFTALE